MKNDKSNISSYNFDNSNIDLNPDNAINNDGKENFQNKKQDLSDEKKEKGFGENDELNKNHCSDNQSSLESEEKTRKKRWGLGALLLLPYFIVCIGIALISVFLFKEYIESSTLWRIAINTNAVSPPTISEGETNENGEIIGGNVEDLSLEPVSKPVAPDATESEEDPIINSDITEQVYYDKNDFPGYKWGELWATLSIPSIGLEEKNVYVGESNNIYKKGIGKRYGTRFPGQGGNIVLGAHVTREFYDLSELKVGDRVYIKTEYGDYIYEIYETVIFSIDDIQYVMNYDDGEKLTLYTCHPRGTAYRTERYGVICKKISGPEWIEIE